MKDIKRIIFATSNKGKVREIGQMTGDKAVEVLTLSDIGFTDEVDETGTTFEENAYIKAKAVYDYIKEKEGYAGTADYAVLADDSGLEIDYYDKAPGVYSHRWLGDRTYPQAMTDVMNDMKDVPKEKRTARFVCAMSAIMSDGEKVSSRETCEGFIAYEMKGENGFGYDPFFYMEEFGCTTAQMSPEQKNEISHRGKALRSILGKLGII